ncbi:MAG: hypothetical protein WCF98_09445 [Synechococcus sp. ELA057]
MSGKNVSGQANGFRACFDRAGLVRCERDGVRLIDRAEGDLVDDLCNLVQKRLRQLA